MSLTPTGLTCEHGVEILPGGKTTCARCQADSHIWIAVSQTIHEKYKKATPPTTSWLKKWLRVKA